MRNACRSVGAGHRRIDEMRDPHGRRRAQDVDALASFGSYTALERRRHGEDGIDATGGALETSLIVEVPGNDRDPTRREGRGGGGLWLPRQRANRVPAGEQFAHQVAALLPCRAGYEHGQLAGHVVLRFITCSFIRLLNLAASRHVIARRHELQQPLGQKGSDCLECLSSRVEFAYTGDEAVRHSHPYVQLGVDARRDGALHVTT